MVLRGHVSQYLNYAHKLCILPSVSRVPSLASNKVTGVSPSHRVLASLTHGVLGRAAAVGPPGVEVTVVVSLRAGGRLALLEKSSGVAIVALSEKVKGSSEDAGGSHSGKEKRLERNHCAVSVADLYWMQ